MWRDCWRPKVQHGPNRDQTEDQETCWRRFLLFWASQLQLGRPGFLCMGLSLQKSYELLHRRKIHQPFVRIIPCLSSFTKSSKTIQNSKSPVLCWAVRPLFSRHHDPNRRIGSQWSSPSHLSTTQALIELRGLPPPLLGVPLQALLAPTEFSLCSHFFVSSPVEVFPSFSQTIPFSYDAKDKSWKRNESYSTMSETMLVRLEEVFLDGYLMEMAKADHKSVFESRTSRILIATEIAGHPSWI